MSKILNCSSSSDGI